MTTFVVTLAPGAAWQYEADLWPDADDGIEIRTTEDAEGLDLEIEEVGGAAEIRKGGRGLTRANSKRLTANRDEPITITGPPAGMRVWVRPRKEKSK